MSDALDTDRPTPDTADTGAGVAPTPKRTISAKGKLVNQFS